MHSPIQCHSSAPVILLDFLRPYIWLEGKTIHLFVTKLSSASYHLVPLWSKCLAPYYFLEDPQCVEVRPSAFRMILNFYSEDVFAVCTTLIDVDNPLSAIPTFLIISQLFSLCASYCCNFFCTLTGLIMQWLQGTDCAY